MNDYEIDTFSQWREHPRQVETRRVTAHSAADALTIVEFELGKSSPRREWVSAIRCVERAGFGDGIKCLECGHPKGAHGGGPGARCRGWPILHQPCECPGFTAPRAAGERR